MLKIKIQLKQKLLFFIFTFFVPLFSAETPAPQPVAVGAEQTPTPDAASTTISSPNKPIIASSTPRVPLPTAAPTPTPASAPAPVGKQ